MVGVVCSCAAAHILVRFASTTEELNVIVTKMLAFSSKSSRNQNDKRINNRDHINEKTTPIQGITRTIATVYSIDSNHQWLLFSLQLDSCYHIWFYDSPL